MTEPQKDKLNEQIGRYDTPRTEGDFGIAEKKEYAAPEITETKTKEQIQKIETIDTRTPEYKQNLATAHKHIKQAPKLKDEMTLRIEKIMEEDLKDAFTELNPVQKQEFKIKGEETANKIKKLLNKTKVNIKKIIKLILNWLKLMPGINKFFLEQEAKIKADKIAALKDINK